MIPRTFSATLVVFVLLLSSGLAGAQTYSNDTTDIPQDAVDRAVGRALR